MKQIVDGREYERDTEDEFWFTREGDRAVLCVCGGDTFRIGRKGWVTYAVCTNCGATDNVHEG